MTPAARRIVETLVLAGTALSLLGHGGNVPTCFAHAVASRTFNVVGTCGPAGVITVTTTPCSVNVTGDDVGVPTSGNLGGTLDDGFQLYGSINSDWNLECDAGPVSGGDAGATVPGAYSLGCRRRWFFPSDGIPDVEWCRADLRPVTPTCDIHACAPVTCSSTEHTVFAATGCCPVCVANGPDDIIPVPPPPSCRLEICPQTCPTGQEMSNPDGGCCGTCQTVPQACLDGRAQWLTEVTDRWATARACTQDTDCAISVIASRCEATCNDAIASDQVATLQTWASARGDELCAACTTQGPPCATNQPSRPACSNGACVLTPP
jgi:hypothetical protein